MKITNKLTDKILPAIWLSLTGKEVVIEDPQYTVSDIDGNDVVDIDSNQIGTI